MASCRNFICGDVVRHVAGWIKYYSALVDDLSHIAHYMVIHYEGLVKYKSNKRIIHELRLLLGWEAFPFRYGFDDGVISLEPIEKSTKNAVEDGGKTQKLRNSSNRRLTGYKTYKNGQLVPSGEEINPHALAYVQASDATVEWELNYDYKLNEFRKESPGIYSQLMRFEKKLNRFCYSLFKLQPICKLSQGDIGKGSPGPSNDGIKYVFMRSRSNLPRVSRYDNKEVVMKELLAELI